MKSSTCKAVTCETQRGEQWEISRLSPYKKNTKVHTERQVRDIAEAIRTQNWTSRIVVDKKGVIVCGHGRWMAAKSLGLKTVPVTVRADLSDAQLNLMRITDNKTSLDTGFDTKTLAEELSSLQFEDVDANFFFTDKEKETLLELQSLNDDALTGSLEEQVFNFENKTSEALKSEKEKSAPIADAFGFKSVNMEQLRKISLLMALIEEETAQAGPDALGAYYDQLAGVA